MHTSSDRLGTPLCRTRGRACPLVGGLVGALALALPAAACESDAHLDLVSLNAWGLPAPLAPDRAGRLAAAAAWLDTDPADLVALQEVWDGAVGVLPLRVARSGPGGDDGLGFVGDHPVDALRFRHAHGFDGLKRKGALRTRRRVGDADVQVVVTHLQAGIGRTPARVRERQLADLLAWIDGVPGPVVLLGDFNVDEAQPHDAAFLGALAGAGFTDVARALGSDHPTYPGNGRRYDRVLVRSGGGWVVEGERFEVVDYDDDPDTHAPVRLSDHRPLRARLVVRRAVAGGGGPTAAR